MVEIAQSYCKFIPKEKQVVPIAKIANSLGCNVSRVNDHVICTGTSDLIHNLIRLTSDLMQEFVTDDYVEFCEQLEKFKQQK